MRGRLYIDDIDAYTEYGVFVEQYGYKSLIQMPSFKKVDSTDWPEENGIEVDLSEPVLDVRSVQIQFCIVNVRYAEDLFDVLSTGGYHTFAFTDLGKTYRLRLTQNGTYKSLIKLGKLTLTFSDDFPEIPTAKAFTLSNQMRQVGFEIDGKDFSDFGSYILADTSDSVRKAATAKDNLKIASTRIGGAIYDAEMFNFKSKDVTLKLLIDTHDITEFWRCWNALFAVILAPDEHHFYYTALGAEYDCYYKSNSVSKFEILSNGHVWCEFTIALVFTDYRPVSQYMLLAHEDFALVEVEVSNMPTFIRIRPRRGISLLIHESGEYIIVNNDNEDTQLFIND